MPAQYDPEVDSWWGIVLTELGLLDPFREENISYLLVKVLSTVLFALLLLALSIRNAYMTMRKQRDDAKADSTRGAYECCNLRNRLRGMENKLYYKDEKLQASNNDIDNERKELRDTIRDLDDQHLADQEEIRSLKQHVSNTECDRDEYGRRLGYASYENRKMVRENQELVQKNKVLDQENRQLEASLTKKDETINALQAHTHDVTSEQVAAVASPIYIKPDEEIEMHHHMHPPTTTTLTSRDTTLEQPAADRGSAERDERVQDLEQQTETLTSGIEGLRTDLEILGNGECSKRLKTQLAEKDVEVGTLRNEKETSDKNSAEKIATLQAKLGENEQEIEDLKEANAKLVADQEASADAARRLSTLSSELEVSRQAHAQCGENSAIQDTRIGELVSSKKQLEDTLGLQNSELGTLQEKHAACGERANIQASEIAQLRNEKELLQGTNADLSQRQKNASDEHAKLMRDGQQVETQNQTLQELQSYSQRETRGLRAQIVNLNQRLSNQQQRIHNLENNCPHCQELREALDAVGKDVEMSDNQSRAEMKSMLAEEIRVELRSQIPDDLRRQVRGEVEQHARSHYSDLLARNTKRIQEQESRIKNMDAELEKARNNPTVDHKACKKREDILQSSVTKLKQDAKILKGNCSRSDDSAKNDREQLNSTRTANEDLRRELEAVKTDQRSAQTFNPLQSKLKTRERELEGMKADRDKARNNCSIYRVRLSDLRKEHEALQNEHKALKEKSSLDDDSPMEGRRSEQPSLPKSPPRIDRRPARQPAGQPTNKAVLGEGAGKKRDRDGSDGEADDEGVDDRKKVRTAVAEDVLHRLKTLGDGSASTQDGTSKAAKDMDDAI